MPKTKVRIYIESMTKVENPTVKIRVWRKEKDMNFSQVENAVHVKEQLIIANKEHGGNLKMICQHILLSHKDINAVEVLSPNSENGIVLYKNWP